jgi:hypothetical protein
MNKKSNDSRDSGGAFKPPGFLFYYVQRALIWGEWSIAQARYYHRRDLLRYQQYQAEQQTDTDDT